MISPKDPFHPPKTALRRFKSFTKSLQAETDRACAILAVSLLDSLLEKLLQKTMIKIPAKQLFQPQGPLSSVSTKIDLCFAMGLIAKDEYNELHLLRKIRNHFAHMSNHRLRFSSPVIRSKVNSLKFPRFLIRLWKEVFDPSEYKKFRHYEKPRERFEVSFGLIHWFLKRRIALTRRVKRPKGSIERYYDVI